MANITKMLNVSTCHITADTLKLLGDQPENNAIKGVHVYRKNNGGYFIYIDSIEKLKQHYKYTNEDPSDLKTVLSFAMDLECSAVCLDKNEEILLSLPSYQYNDGYEDNKAVSVERCYCGGRLMSQTSLSYHVKGIEGAKVWA